MTRLKLIAASLAFLVLSCGGAVAVPMSVSGRVIYDGPERGRVIVNLYKLDVLSGGRTARLSKGDIYGDMEPLQTLELDKPGSYIFEGLVPGRYSVVAFVDTDGNRRVGKSVLPAHSAYQTTLPNSTGFSHLGRVLGWQSRAKRSQLARGWHDGSSYRPGPHGA